MARPSAGKMQVVFDMAQTCRRWKKNRHLRGRRRVTQFPQSQKKALAEVP
jgi:hypothetical protein